MSKSKKENSGCLQFFILSILSGLAFIIIYIIFSFSAKTVMLFAIAVSILFLKLVLGNTTLKSLLKSGLVVYVISYGFIFIIKMLLGELSPITEEKISFIEEEETTKTVTITENDTTVLYTSHRSWTDNYGNSFKGDLSVRETDYNRLKNNTEQFKISSKKYFWGSLYNYLEQKDTPSLDLIMETFIKINKDKKLNQMEFAEMVVTCIQDIPYSFVLQGDCPNEENYDDSNRAILENCPECCIGNIKFGIQNPVSFIKNLKGDCDTRTVIVYSILKYFNYDVAIVNSDFYRHSIIGINLPTNGDLKIYKGKKYALWETTAKYYKAGELPVNFNNVAHWDIVLTSK